MTMYDVVGLGNAIVDVISAADDSFLLEHHIAKGVMTLIDESRAEQLCRAVADPVEIAGGSAANTMSGLASLGAKAVFVGKVKADPLGESFQRSLRALGVEYSAEPASAGPPTACCLIVVTPDGHRSMNTFLGASREIGPEDIDEKVIAAAQVLYVEGYLWDTPDAKSAIANAIAVAKRAERRVAFTLSDPFCVARWRNEFCALMVDLDILFANEEEAKALFETDDLDRVVQALRLWTGIAVVTRSEKGCIIVRGDETHVLDASPVAAVLDTTGAGDQFAAGFLYGLTHGKDLTQSGRLGSLAAAEVLSHYGARPETSLRALALKQGLL